MPQSQSVGATFDTTADEATPIIPKAAGSKSDGGITWIMGTAIVVNHLIGGGMLTLPYSVVHSGGLALGISIEIFIAVVLWGSTIIYGWLAADVCFHSLQDVVGSYLGKAGSAIASGILFVVPLLACGFYLIAIRDQVHLITLDNAGPNLLRKWYLDPRFMVTMITVFIIAPLCFFPKIDQLKEISAFAMLCVLYIAGVVIAGYFAHDLQQGHNEAHMAQPGRAKGRVSRQGVSAALFSVASSSVAYFCQAGAILVYDRLKPRTLHNYVVCATWSHIIVLVFYNMIIIFTVLSFGSATSSNIILNYNQKNGFVLAGTIAYTAKLICEYAIMHFISRDGFLGLVRLYATFEPYSRSDIIAKTILTIILTALALIIGILVRDIMIVVLFLGAVFVFLAIPLPGLCLFQRIRTATEVNLRGMWKKIGLYILSVFYILFGTFAVCVAAKNAIEEVIGDYRL